MQSSAAPSLMDTMPHSASASSASASSLAPSSSSAASSAHSSIPLHPHPSVHMPAVHFTHSQHSDAVAPTTDSVLSSNTNFEPSPSSAAAGSGH